MADFRIVAAGDATLVAEFERRIDPDVNARVIDAAGAIEREAIPGVRDIVPTYCSVAVCFDPLKTDVERLQARIGAVCAASRDRRPPTPGRTIEVPVCYGGEYGPDLDEVASYAGISAREAIEIHAAVEYRVFMLGFLPGFPYLGVVDPRIAAPRRPTPRPRVPRGSVGIAGRQTGIYPIEAPGGWQLIGRTPLEPFDAARPDPFLFRPGDRVRFVAIEPSAFAAARAAGTE